MDVTGHTTSSRPKAASIRDVAKAAGVSHQTVSRVINGSSKVKEATRDRVLAAVEELGFRRSATAVALAHGRTRALTVLTGNTTLYGYAAVLQGIEEASRAAGMSLAISVLESDEETAVRAAVEHAVDDSGALIVIAYDKAGVQAQRMIPEDVPHVVAVETPADDEGRQRPWIWTDDRAAAAEATRYLLGLGHRTVHYVAIPLLTESSPRAAGWRTALLEAGAPVPEPLGDGWDTKAGYEAGRMLAADPSVTAVLCGNDDLALGVIRAMHEAGRAIPGEVSVIGFDDAPQSAYFTPSLTTVRLDFAGLGRACFSLLHDQIAEPVIAPHLIIRESTGSPA
ncbi:DNA-binding LacI/PurR family transcriptional regulator [Kibdelosporangium banguiense]|uniref:DNA-binding LacI/PurR family transcriptional regulator n=1 Tax=Kibdelosporangium banguiense TaxID=1365924 RepID=A0ABS4TNR6_9PSEU|nr:LacI family DNA-binding transcriptional regulator [Kibdelosporangium banguiense]MBP2326024.1 DNA-binding LacI/PurR family transcriptional regulator [Kibdelosporangium banguiense]